MYDPVQATDITSSVKASCVRRLLRSGLVFIAASVTWFISSQPVQAVIPPPDGGYPNENTAEGDNALFSLADGYSNTAVGFQALYSNTDGYSNTANGANALVSNTTGFQNTATGVNAMVSNTTGFSNMANGDYALYSNTTGNNNTASGASALYGNTTGNNNTADGYLTLTNNSTGRSNTASGFTALYNNTTGIYNTANGANALYHNTTGYYNTAGGYNALFANTTGFYNTAIGLNSLFSNTTGSNNTASGLNALYGNSSGVNNIAVGYSAGSNLTTGSNNIDLGNSGIAAEANTIRIGTVGSQQAAFIAGISGKTVAGGVGVVIDTQGRLGTIVSSERFKDGIKAMDKASEAILSLKPVTFQYNKALDPQGIPQFGLVAEQVAKVNPDLVARDEEGKPYTVRYEAVNAMLLNEFLKEHKRAQEQGAAIVELKSVVAQQQEQITSLASQIKTVSNRLELSRGTPRVVASDP
jgi:uncharacterized coiled-coil protein SlyX